MAACVSLVVALCLSFQQPATTTTTTPQQNKEDLRDIPFAADEILYLDGGGWKAHPSDGIGDGLVNWSQY